MSTNLISSITQVLTPELLARIASALGLDKFVVEKAVSAGIPALLAALISRASTGEKAAALNAAVANQKPGILTNLANVIGEAGQGAMVDSSINSLTSILGHTTANALTSAVGKFADIGAVGGRSLLGLLGPVVMGVLGQQQSSTGLSASEFLVSQKKNIAKAVPRGFSEYLRGTDILDGIADATADQGSVPQGTVHYAVDAAKKRPWERPASQSSWLLPALALAALAGLAWYLFSDRTPATTVEKQIVAKPAEEQVVAEVLKPGNLEAIEAFRSLSGIKVGDVDLGAQLTKTVNDLRSSLEGIKDEGTAQSVLPALTLSKDEFDKVSGLVAQLTPESRTSLASGITAVKPTLNQLFDSALAIPGVGSVIKPTVDTIRSRLDVLAEA